MLIALLFTFGKVNTSHNLFLVLTAKTARNSTVMDFVDPIVTNAYAAWNWTAGKDCQVGLSLSLLCIVLSMLGDKVLYQLFSPTKAASPELAPTAVLRPIANLSLSSWVMYFAIKQTVLAFGISAVCIGAVAYTIFVALFSVWLLEFAYRGPSKGISINVREPKASFGRKNYSHRKSAVAPALFFNFSWIHLSALLVPFELCIHIVMVSIASLISLRIEHCNMLPLNSNVIVSIVNLHLSYQIMSGRERP